MLLLLFSSSDGAFALSFLAALRGVVWISLGRCGRVSLGLGFWGCLLGAFSLRCGWGLLSPFSLLVWLGRLMALASAGSLWWFSVVAGRWLCWLLLFVGFSELVCLVSMARP
ncbi:hypothetical protein [Metapseudomonas resinovorans]|uniref:hypothetical protein n=1 Tax=Metapseudomonas resinovorans TaxID=53412 RepID=UPI0012DFCB39|nr:hypothetical protein [Pseudomonas resinovorans]